MKTCYALARWILCIALALPVTAAAQTSQDTRSALELLVASQKLEQNVPAVLANARANGVALVREGFLKSLAENTSMSEPERARARALLDELAPQLAATVDAQYQQLDMRAIMIDMIEAVYPKYFSAAEIRALAGFYASPAYQKSVSMMLASGRDKNTLQAPFGVRLSAEDERRILAFHNSPLGRKQQELGARIAGESRDYLARRLAPARDAAVAAQRELIIKAITQAAAQ